MKDAVSYLAVEIEHKLGIRRTSGSRARRLDDLAN